MKYLKQTVSGLQVKKLNLREFSHKRVSSTASNLNKLLLTMRIKKCFKIKLPEVFISMKHGEWFPLFFSGEKHASRRSSCPEVLCKKCFLEISQNSQENTCARVFFYKAADLTPTTLLKKRLWHRCSPVNFAKFV